MNLIPSKRKSPILLLTMISIAISISILAGIFLKFGTEPTQPETIEKVKEGGCKEVLWPKEVPSQLLLNKTPRWQSGDIINSRRVIDNVEIRQPLLIQNSEVALRNLSISLLEPTWDFIKVRNSVLHLYSFPVLPKENPPWVIDAENSTIIIWEKSSALGLTLSSLEAFTRIVNSRIIYMEEGEYQPQLGPVETGEFKCNVVEFRNGALGAAWGDNTFKYFGPLHLGDPEPREKVRFQGYEVTIGDFRPKDEVEIELYRAHGSGDPWNFVDRTKIKIMESTDIVPFFQGEAQGKIIASDGVSLQVYGQAQVMVKNSQFQGDPSSGAIGEVMIGNQAKVLWDGGKIEGRTMVFDTANLTLKNVKLAENEIVVMGNASLTLDNAQPLGKNFGVLIVFDNAQVVVKNSQLYAVYLLDNSSLVLEDTNVDKLYYQVTVHGQASIDARLEPSWNGEVTVPYIKSDTTSKLNTFAISHVLVEEGGYLMVSNYLFDTLQGGVYVYGDATFENSSVQHLFVYGKDSTLTLNNTRVKFLYGSIHVRGEARIDRFGFSGDVILASAQTDEKSTVEHRRLGMIHTYGDAQLTLVDRALERIVIEDQVKATIKNVTSEYVTVRGNSQVTINQMRDTFAYDSPEKPILLMHQQAMPLTKFRLFIYPYPTPEIAFPPTPGQLPLTDTLQLPLEIYDNAKVKMRKGPYEIKVMGEAILELDRANLLVAIGEAQVILWALSLDGVMPSGWIEAGILLDEAKVKALDGPVGGSHVLLFDNSTLIPQCSSSQDLFLGRLHQPEGNAIAIGFYKNPGHTPAHPAEVCSKPYLSGTVFIVPLGVIGDSRLSHYPDLDFPEWADSIRVFVNSRELPAVDREKYQISWLAFKWDTTQVENGWHTITVIPRKGDRENGREIKIEVRN